MNRAAFRRLSDLRLREAKALFDNQLYAGSYYLAGYSIECALKACICRNIRQGDFPPDRRALENIYSHDFTRLIRGADLTDELDQQQVADLAFDVNWTLVSAWSEEARYEVHDRMTAQAFLEAIEDQSSGVLPWLRTYW